MRWRANGGGPGRCRVSAWRPRLALCLGLCLAVTGAVPPVLAEESGPSDEAERLAGEGLAKILQALDLLLKAIPQYAAPEVQPNGDIIIRRLHPEEEELEPDAPEGDPDSGTET